MASSSVFRGALYGSGFSLPAYGLVAAFWSPLAFAVLAIAGAVCVLVAGFGDRRERVARRREVAELNRHYYDTRAVLAPASEPAADAFEAFVETSGLSELRGTWPGDQGAPE